MTLARRFFSGWISFAFPRHYPQGSFVFEVLEDFDITFYAVNVTRDTTTHELDVDVAWSGTNTVQQYSTAQHSTAQHDRLDENIPRIPFFSFLPFSSYRHIIHKSFARHTQRD